MWIWFILAGLLSGIIAGMGMGGGTFLIPVLTLFLGVTQKLAQSINLLVFIPTAIIALIIHIKNKLVVTKVGIIMILSGVLFSLIGAWLATGMENDDLRLYFGFLIGIVQLIDSIIQVSSKTKMKGNVFVVSKLNIYESKKND